MALINLKNSALFMMLVFTFAFGLNATAQDQKDEFPDKEKLAAIEEYFKIVPTKKTMDDMAEKVAKTLPEFQRAQFLEMMTKEFNVELLESAAKKSMYKRFTLKEIKMLNEFYKKPEGLSIMEKMGDYMADIMPVIQSEMTRIMIKQTKSNKK